METGFSGMERLSQYQTQMEDETCIQGLVKGEKFCFRNLDFYFRQGETTFTANQFASPAIQKSKDLNKVLLLLQDLGVNKYLN